MKVVGERILVKKIEEKKKDELVEKAGAFIIPDSIEENGVNSTEEVEVIEVGKKVEEVSPGDKLIINKHSGIEVVVDKVTYKVITEGEILIKR